MLGSSTPGGSSGPMLRGVSFGGGAGEKFGQDVSATTKADNVYRSGSRVGKREDPITRRIDFNYPELFKVAIKQSKPLSETSDKQGYNGNYANEHALTNKVSGGAPADPLFSRSLDFLAMDMIYQGLGQYNKHKDVNYNEYKAKTASYNGGSLSYTDIDLVKDNYLLKDLTVTINDKGAVGFSWSEDAIGNQALTDDIVKLCADHSLRQVNQLELDRLNMVSKAGNESDPSWCPYGDAIVTATAVNHISKDIDQLAGNNIFLSERKLAEALAFQVNKAAKDGVRIKGPMAEMLNGNIEGAKSSATSTISEANGISYAFDADAYSKGSAGLWLAINDSLTKYTTKGKLLTMPLSFKNALTIAKQNDGEFRVNDIFYKDVCHSELFSTIDKPYSPVDPVVLTDKANVTNPISFASTGNTVSVDADTEPSAAYIAPIMTVHYENLRNRYDIPVYNFFVQGLHDWFTANASRLFEKLPQNANGTNNAHIRTLVIPVQSSTTSISLWDLIVCSAIPYMVPRRQKSLVEVIKYQLNFGYPYTGSTPIKDLDVDYALNYSFKGIDYGLETKIANPIDSIKVKFPEVFWPVRAFQTAADLHDGSGKAVIAQTVLPHYFSQNNFVERQTSSTDHLLILSDNPSNISYPSTRSGVMLSDMDTIYGLSEEDYRLALDRMVVYPGYLRALNHTLTDDNTVFPVVHTIFDSSKFQPQASMTYKYGMTGDGIPVINYIASAEETATDDVKACLTIKDVMSTPRELGLHFVAPSGVLTPVNVSGTANYRNTASGYLAVSGPGFTAYIYKIAGKDMGNAILSDANYVIDFGDAFSNTYVVHQTVPTNASNDYGFVLSISKDIKATATNHTFSLGAGSYDMIPFVTGSYAGESYTSNTGVYGLTETAVSNAGNDKFNVISFQKYFWTRLQRLPFVINPFDSNSSDLSFTAITTTTGVSGNKYDIYDFMYFFGFCGFRASDFSELTYERNKNRISLGMNYVNDPYIDKTLLLK